MITFANHNFCRFTESFKTRINGNSNWNHHRACHRILRGETDGSKKCGRGETQLVAKAQVLAANIEQIKLHHASEVQSMKSQMENERLYAAKLRAESDQQWAQKLESLKQEMHRMTIEQQKVAAEQLAAKQSALQETNRLQMDELLKPIKEQFADFKKSVEESKTQNEVNKKELQNTFEATMKLFQQEQQQAVLNLKEQTEKIGSDAANLTKALKGDSKMQGDWGEMVLETILENSGLRKDEEFFIQENTKDEEERTIVRMSSSDSRKAEVWSSIPRFRLPPIPMLWQLKMRLNRNA